MQQRQLRLGDILDDYCPRERRVTNHAIVAMVDQDVKQTRCTTCDAEHEYKHAKIPRQRRKNEPAALYAQALAGAQKRIAHEPDAPESPSEPQPRVDEPIAQPPSQAAAVPEAESIPPGNEEDLGEERESDEEEGPIHRRLIRATLPRPEGQTPTRQIPEFTIRQPGGRPNRFRPRPGGARGGQMFSGRGNGNPGGGPMRSGGGRPTGGRPGGPHNNRQRSGRKRSK